MNILHRFSQFSVKNYGKIIFNRIRNHKNYTNQDFYHKGGGTILHHRFTDISPIRHRLYSAENSTDTKLKIFFFKQMQMLKIISGIWVHEIVHN